MHTLSLEIPGTSTGLSCCPFAYPMPSWPRWLSPQHFKLPPVAMAHMWPNPEKMATAESKPARGVSVGKKIS